MNLVQLNALKQALAAPTVNEINLSQLQTDSVDATTSTGTLNIGTNSGSVVIKNPNLYLNTNLSLSNPTITNALNLTSAGGGNISLAAAPTASNKVATIPAFSGTLAGLQLTTASGNFAQIGQTSVPTPVSTGLGATFVCGQSGKAMIFGLTPIQAFTGITNTAAASVYYNTTSIPTLGTSVGTDTKLVSTSQNQNFGCTVSVPTFTVASLTPGTTYNAYLAYSGQNVIFGWVNSVGYGSIAVLTW